MVRFGRSAAQIIQNGHCQLGLPGCAPCSPSGGPFWPLSSPNPPKRTLPAASAWLCSLLSLWWSVLAAQKPKSVKTDFMLFQPHRSLSFSLPGAPFCPLSGPNPPKRTLPASSAWLCSLLSLWWSVLAAQQPKSSKTDLASLVSLAVLLALPLVVRFGRSAAQILQNGLRQLGQLGCPPCSPSGGPFWPLSSPNPPKRTSPPLSVVRFGRSVKTDFPCSSNLIGLCPSLCLVLRFVR